MPETERCLQTVALAASGAACSAGASAAKPANSQTGSTSCDCNWRYHCADSIHCRNWELTTKIDRDVLFKFRWFVENYWQGKAHFWGSFTNVSCAGVCRCVLVCAGVCWCVLLCDVCSADIFRVLQTILFIIQTYAQISYVNFILKLFRLRSLREPEVWSAHHTHTTHTTHTQLISNYTHSHISPHFTTTTHHYIVSYHFNNSQL